MGCNHSDLVDLKDRPRSKSLNSQIESSERIGLSRKYSMANLHKETTPKVASPETSQKGDSDKRHQDNDNADRAVRRNSESSLKFSKHRSASNGMAKSKLISIINPRKRRKEQENMNNCAIKNLTNDFLLLRNSMNSRLSAIRESNIKHLESNKSHLRPEKSPIIKIIPELESGYLDMNRSINCNYEGKWLPSKIEISKINSSIRSRGGKKETTISNISKATNSINISNSFFCPSRFSTPYQDPKKKDLLKSLQIHSRRLRAGSRNILESSIKKEESKEEKPQRVEQSSIQFNFKNTSKKIILHKATIKDREKIKDPDKRPELSILSGSRSALSKNLVGVIPSSSKRMVGGILDVTVCKEPFSRAIKIRKTRKCINNTPLNKPQAIYGHKSKKHPAMELKQLISKLNCSSNNVNQGNRINQTPASFISSRNSSKSFQSIENMIVEENDNSIMSYTPEPTMTTILDISIDEVGKENINQYVLGQILGTGGYATVKKAKSRTDKNIYVGIKSNIRL